MGEPILNLQQTLTVSVGASRHETDWKPKRVSWEAFCDKMRHPVRTSETMEEYAELGREQKAQIKDVGGYVGGEVVGGNRKSGAIQSRQLVCLDADFGSADLWDNWLLMDGRAALMHSTHSSTPDKPRFRFLIPLSRSVTASEYEPIARRLAELIDIEAFDDTTYEPARLMFWPSVSSDAEYVFESCQGDWVDPDEILHTYSDWRDMREWPVSSRQEKIVRKMGERQGNPLEKPGIIGAFNRAYSITAAIEKYLPGVYTPCGSNRWTYAAGTTLGGAVTYDNDTFIYSHHDTDPISGRLCSAYDMVRLHLYGNRDAGQDSDLPNMPSSAAMKQLCSQDEAVREQLAESLRRDPDEVFAQVDDLGRFTDDLTEQGGAVAFIDQYGQNIRYANAFGWLLWDGTRWVTDAEAEVAMLVMHFTDSLYETARVELQAAEDKPAQDRAKAHLQFATKLRTAKGRGNLMTLARTIVYEPHPEEYDASPWDLNTPDGMIDLRTGALRPHEARARATKLTSCGLAATPQGKHMWDEFIRHITNGDDEFAAYLQELAGMAAVGEVLEEGLVISYGPGGNGKSTFFGALQQVLGDYAKSINADVIVPATGHADQSYIAALRGVRLAVMGETDEGARLRADQMKRLTSRDVIVARALYKDPIEFRPTHTTIMHTNHLPRLNSLDGGTKRRLAIAPFPATLPPERVITNYESLLVQEAGGAILQWIVDGAVRFFEAGCKLNKPRCVKLATENYIASEDAVQMFIDEECEVDPDYREAAGLLYKKFSEWAKSNGLWERTQTLFGRALDEKGYKAIHYQHKRCRQGLRLNSFDEV